MFSYPHPSMKQLIHVTTSDDASRMLHWRNTALYHVHTTFLFTKSDIKTILIPVTIFSAMLAPINSLSRLWSSLFWTWLHLLHFCIANQSSSVSEDLSNKPWRPLPSQRITPLQAMCFRWALVPVCLAFSQFHGSLPASLILLTATWIYNDLGGHEHGLVKNFLNVVGYVAFELGATVISENEHFISPEAVCALGISGLVILTTVHAGDIPDIEGDLSQGRRTLPILFPTLTRPALAATIMLWSGFGSYLVWSISATSSLVLCLVGAVVAWRFLALRTTRQDKLSCFMYNVWLSGMHFAIAVAADRIHWKVAPAIM